MQESFWNWREWRFRIAALLALLACGAVLKSTKETRPPAAPANQPRSESQVDFVYERQEPVGWVFGRMVGFEGADKPLLPRQMQFVPPSNSYSH